MSEMDLARATWRKSSRSGSNGDDCVEIAAVSHGVAVRDSKNPKGAVLGLTMRDWRMFLDNVKDSTFDLQPRPEQR
jgi:hypothetical protein